MLIILNQSILVSEFKSQHPSTVPLFWSPNLRISSYWNEVRGGTCGACSSSAELYIRLDAYRLRGKY